ncbi:MAG: hypothetical protein JWQ09_4210 [Segetibacter sp.]|nr:hypothetical protein [Segetibacter sp.]
MNTEVSQLEFIKSQVSKKIVEVDRNRRRYRKWSYYVFISTTFLAGITTIILGLNLTDWQTETRIYALILTTIITVLNALSGFNNHNELWIIYNTTLNKLRNLEFNIDYCEKGLQPISPDQVELFKKTYQDAMEGLENSWQKSKIQLRK